MVLEFYPLFTLYVHVNAYAKNLPRCSLSLFFFFYGWPVVPRALVLILFIDVIIFMALIIKTEY
jgi:hypothetical protein